MRHEEVAGPRQHTRDHRDEDTQSDIAVTRETTGAHHDHLLPEGCRLLNCGGLHQASLQMEGNVEISFYFSLSLVLYLLVLVISCLFSFHQVKRLCECLHHHCHKMQHSSLYFVWIKLYEFLK